MKRKSIALAVASLLIMNLGVAPAQALPPGGRSLYVGSGGENQVPPGQGAIIFRFTFDAGGVLTPAESLPACGGSRGPVFTPDLRFAYNSCVFAGQIGLYSVAENGVLTSIGHVDFPRADGIAIAPNGRTLYVDSVESNTLAAFRVETDGQLTPLNSNDSGAVAPKKVAVTPDGRFIYVSHGLVTDTAESVLTGFALGADGSLAEKVAEVPNGPSGFEIVITPDGRFLYVTSSGSNRVFGYQIGADGSLMPVPGQSFPSGERSVGAAISPDGRWIYIAAPGPANASPGEITGWAIGVNGALTEVERLTTDGDPPGIEFAPDGRHLYVADFLNDKVTAYRVSARGKLKAIQTVDSGGPDPSSQSITVLPNLGPTASFSVQAGVAESPTRFDGSASSDPDGTVTRYLWDFGDGTSRQTKNPNVQHVYEAPGTYEVSLTVIDDEGCSNRLIFTGQLASCVGSDAATATQIVIVN